MISFYAIINTLHPGRPSNHFPRQDLNRNFDVLGEEIASSFSPSEVLLDRVLSVIFIETYASRIDAHTIPKHDAVNSAPSLHTSKYG